MARLTAAQRKRLPDSAFAVIEKKRNKKTGKTEERRRFPIKMKDKAEAISHAKAAKRLLGRAKGIDSEERSDILRKANKVLYGINSSKAQVPASKRKKRKNLTK